MALIPRGRRLPAVQPVASAPAEDEGEDYQPAIFTPTGGLNIWEWSAQLRPPAATDFQETWSKVVQPVRAVALLVLWLTWHWTRTAAFVLLLILVAVLVHTA